MGGIITALNRIKFPALIKRHKLAAIFAVGIAIRLVIMPITAHPFDVYAWYYLSNNILASGPFALQNFPPVWYHYMLVPVSYLYSSLSGILPSTLDSYPMSSLPADLNFYPSFSIQFIPGLLFDLIVKLPFLISDIMICFLLYKLVILMTNNKGLAEKAAVLWFLNPFVIWISAGWGMWDSLPVLFSLLSFYLLLRKKIAFSAICLAIGVGIKIYPIIFLVPVGLYLLRTSAVKDRLKNSLKYYSIFFLSTFVIISPYISALPWFFSDYVIPNSIGINNTVTNILVAPFGYGLNYWSLSLLIRLFNIPIAGGTVLALSVLSFALIIVGLALAYIKTSRLTFEKPEIDLAIAYLLCLLSFFLTYRMVAEQYFLWALPFIILLCIAGRIKSVLYWITTSFAVLYSVLNCPLPFFFLPLSPWIKENLLGFVYLFSSVDLLRILVLVIIGCSFSAILLFIFYKIGKSKQTK